MRLENPINSNDVPSRPEPAFRLAGADIFPAFLNLDEQRTMVADLRAVVVGHNRNDRHGKTSHLTPAQVDDLVAYLLSL